MVLQSDDVDPEDLEFMSPRERMMALGLDGDNVIVPEGTITTRGIVVESPTRRPAPGRIVLRVAEVARARGVVHTKGQHAGKVSIMGISRGTDLFYTTIVPYINDPGSLSMVHLDTLSRLCAFLACTPGDLLQYQPDLTQQARLSESYKKG